ncbi:MAG: DNA polymerase III subunit chi [Alphaproteobacteria bacterium]|nr:DNA polymerase III subunit chi [Alphaproteobacteria bacterium]
MAEILFYHLERTALDGVLPDLLKKTLERGWRAVVVAGSPERVEALDAHLWTFSPEAFLPHGTASDGQTARQPIYLTASLERPNAPDVLFCVDGAAPPDWGDPMMGELTRLILIFDGNDEGATAAARAQWKSAKAAGHTLAYWQQTPHGKWQCKETVEGTA